jgi:hypothetical protein
MVWCWWCCHPFEGVEKHYPFKYDEKRRKFTTAGHFCSWSCVKAWAIDEGGPRAGERQMYLALMRKHEYGKYVPCFAAPKRQMLAVFGGTLTIEEFREKSAKEPPSLTLPFEMHILPIMSTTAMTTAAMVRADEDDDLKLRREKPLARAKSKLESALGIVRKVK